MHVVKWSLAIRDLLTLPPGFVAVPEGNRPGCDPWAEALLSAAAGADPGSVHWSGAGGMLRAAMVLAPDRPMPDGAPILSLGALALFDGLATLAPPQVPMHLLPPDGLAVDGGRVATLRAALAPCRPDEAPEWAALGIEVAVGLRDAAPGDAPDRTSLHEEGFGDVTAGDVLAHTLRHLLAWMDAWGQDGQAALDHALRQRTARGTVAA